jgi:large subunit ribosomal protein L10
MTITKSKKVEILAELETVLKDAQSVAFATNNALTVAEVSKMRADLRKVGSVYMLAKKTLIKIAFKKVFNVDIADDLLPGQIAILVNKTDKVAGLNIINKYVVEFKKEGKIKLTGLFLDGNLLGAAEASKIASLPSRETLLAKLLGSMKSPLGSFVRFLNSAKGELETKNLATIAALATKTAAPAETPAETPAA